MDMVLVGYLGTGAYTENDYDENIHRDKGVDKIILSKGDLPAKAIVQDFRKNSQEGLAGERFITDAKHVNYVRSQWKLSALDYFDMRVSALHSLICVVIQGGSCALVG